MDVFESTTPAIGPPVTTDSGERRSLAATRAAIPERLFRPDPARAAACLAVGLAFFAGAEALAWWTWTRGSAALFPASWFVGGMAFTSLFVLGHDCGHASFLRSRRLMNVLGHALLLPAFYPYYAWKFSHDAHHAHTNRLARTPDIYCDNAWTPLTTEQHRRLRVRARLAMLLYRVSRAVPPIGSLLHLAVFHFDPSMYRPDHRRKVYVSYAVLAAALAAATALLWRATGSPWAVLHFWLIPAVFFQLWMSTYTFLHHTSEDTLYLDDADWTPYEGQVRGTVTCAFPRWISFLHFNIDIHLPHHVAVAIPCYHLREAHDALRRSAFANDVKEVPFSIGYLLRQVRACKLWDRRAARYRTFAEAEARAAS